MHNFFIVFYCLNQTAQRVQDFDRFKGSMIELNSDKIKYDDMILELDIADQDLKTIFTKGIFYPQIFTGNTKAEELVGNGNFRISNFEEINFVNINPKSKRFRFWLFTNGMANPKVFFLELTNENAIEKIDLREFLKNSKLTFAKSGWTVL